MWEGPEHILDLEMREQLRREEAEEYITSLPEDEREAGVLDEERNVNEYERRQELMFSGQHPETVEEPEEKGPTTVPSPSAKPVPSSSQDMLHGGFKCDFPGCSAPSFQTQYLLK